MGSFAETETETRMKTTFILLFTGLIAVATNVNLEDIDRLANVKLGSGQTRKPRLFLVTTASTTSTVAVTTTCWTSVAVNGGGTAPSGTCTGRKRRSILETIEKDFNFDVDPTYDIDSGLENDEQLIEDEIKRTGRQNFFNFLLYWATTTTTITSNSTVNGIVTISLADAGCLPSGVSSKCA